MDFDLTSCMLCPRECGSCRTTGQTGVCGQTDKIRAARAALHYWEEPCISGANGSGAVFFCGCNLKCIFCQNYDIAHNDGYKGIELSSSELAEIFLSLQDENANNINLVTPSHFVPQIAKSIEKAKLQGLNIPVLYNTSSYEKAEVLKSLDGLIDIYLPDFKYMDEAKARKYSGAPNYSAIAKAAIAEMYRQVGTPIFSNEKSKKNSDPGNSKITENVIYENADKKRIMTRGMIVRHMVLPLGTKNAKDVIKYLYETYNDKIFISILNQYTPPCEFEKSRLLPYPELNRKVTAREYNKVVDYALSLGIENAFIQEGSAAKESFIPGFHGEGIISQRNS